MHRLRLNDSVTHFNVAYNELLTGEKLISLVEFLSLNKTCANLNLAGCQLNVTDMMFLGQGLSKNSAIQRLVLTDNSLEDKRSLEYLCKGLANSKCNPKLIELELQRCSLSTDSVMSLVGLLSSKYKLRSLNLRDNGIVDEAAVALHGAIKINPFLSRILLEMNPARLNITQDIE